MKIARRSKATSDQLAHVTREMYKQNLELAERNKTLTLLRRIDEVVLGSAGEVDKVNQSISDALVDETDFSFAAVYVTDKHRTHALAEGISSKEKLSPVLTETIKNHLGSLSLHSAQTSLSRAISTKQVQLAKNFTDIKKNVTDTDNNQLKSSLNVSSLFICPLRASNRFIGVLIIGVPVAASDISPFLKGLTDRLTSTVSIAVENRLLYEELQDVSARLRVQNRKLVQLDKTKDEFISMASHQLRTPLTAVKGYLSMVLEGDVGKVKKAEKEYIQKAFDSAQRMVYLIADMLNVSRLQTGKFVIENQQTDLAKLVEGEIAQLQETADSRHVKLIYHKPGKFPVLNLDDNKIRQVVMNFLDNAIYYTPAEGSVTVQLSESDKEISFTVTDTGIGIPASVQHHLFSKFYRADNARKMRPDGTGLGLFMAKKVITAQGGAIIFKSTEGKGSTFGFSFPRHGVETKEKLPTEKTAAKPEIAAVETR